MKTTLPVWYLRPAAGGIHDYSELMLRVYRLTGRAPEVVTVDETGLAPGWRGLAVGWRLAWRGPAVVHAELGFHGAVLVWALLVICLFGRQRVIITVHEGDPIVETLFPLRQLSLLPRPWCSLANRLRRVLDALVMRRLTGWVIRRAQAIVTLAEDQVVYGRATRALPHPIYVPDPPAFRSPARPTVGFLGYWGGAKGLETLIGAAGQLQRTDTSVRFIVAGSTGDVNDAYSRSIRRLAGKTGAQVEFPGFIPEDQMLAFFQGLSVLVIPYHPSLSGLSSGMAVWAANMGIPVIASDTPALRRQLGDSAAYVPPQDPTALAAALSEFFESPQNLIDLARRRQSRLLKQQGDAVLAEHLQQYLNEMEHA